MERVRAGVAFLGKGRLKIGKMGARTAPTNQPTTFAVEHTQQT
jgi:hypothetical protein